MEPFEKAKKSLMIQDVLLRSTNIELNSHYDPDDIVDGKFDIETFNGCGRVSETCLDSDDGTEVFEYNFAYYIGIRLVKTKIEDELDDDELDDDELDDDGLDDDGGEIPLEIKASFSSNYISHEKIDQDALLAFSQDNVGYHVWPYWREFVQSSTARMGISTITVPFYKCKNK